MRTISPPKVLQRSGREERAGLGYCSVPALSGWEGAARLGSENQNFRIFTQKTI